MCDNCGDDLIYASCQTHKLVHNYVNILFNLNNY